MALSQLQRWLVLGGALALTLAAMAWVTADSDGSPGAAREAAPPRASAPERAASLDPARIKRPVPDADALGNLFAKQSWYVPPPPAPTEPPPIPYTYFGKEVMQDGSIKVFLAQEGRYHVVTTGDVIDGRYRVDAIDPAIMTLTYLPLGRQQQLQIGRAK